MVNDMRKATEMSDWGLIVAILGWLAFNQAILLVGTVLFIAGILHQHDLLG